MKPLVILCLSLCHFFMASPALRSQPAIRYDSAYTLADTSKHCKVELTVVQQPKLRATLWVNTKRYTGYLVRNKYNKELVYNFYPIIGGKKKLLMLEFQKEEGNDCYEAIIINQEYDDIFEPCPDDKYIELQSCE
jgi:hypothetical protein